VRQNLIASPAEAEARATRLAPVLADVADEGATCR
jgi:predicted N-formylglutamate amidohydrolase